MIERTESALKFAVRLEKQLRLKQAKLRSLEAVPSETPAARREGAGSPFVSSDTLSQADALAAEIEELAAVSGRFDPNDLIAPNVSDSVRLATLSRLACTSSVEVEGGTKKWLLERGRRIEALTRLVRENRLAAKLTSALPDTDRFGEMLRQVLRDGEAIPLDGLSRDDLLAMSAAVEATAALDVPKPDPNQLRQLLSKTRFLADYEVLLEHGFVGRANELQTLQTFLHGPGTGSRQWSGMVLTGLGGAGKSTLLAKFASDAIGNQAATVVILDFDRPGIDPADTYWLEMEMASQVGLQHPATDEMLRQLRDETRRYRAEIDVQQSFMADERDVERGLRGVVSEIHTALVSVSAADRPFLLVLDTFEEVTQRDFTARIVDWLDEIAERLWPTPLRVVFSGRLFDAGRAALQSSGITDDVEVAELEPEHARRLLQSLKVPEPWAGRLANSDVLPRRPLELKLLARLVLEGSASSLDELENELRQGGKPARDLFAGLVYRRVLLRIRDETARALAYPGLVLRYVSAPLVQEVLAPALDFPSMDDSEANRALEALAGHDWLAYRGPNGEVWHRKDLRRSMLKAMIAEDPEKAGRISRSAAEYFAQFTDDRNWAEGIYHRLMLVRSRDDGERFELDELKKANEYIAGDIADLPPDAAALLRFAAGQQLPPSDVPLLPGRYLEAAYRATGAGCAASREFGLAAQLFADIREKGLISPSTAAQPWEVETLFATVSWDRLKGLEGIGRRPSRKRQYNIRDVVELVFPQMIVSPSEVDPAEVARVLGAAGHTASSKMDASQRQTLLSRLAVGLVLLESRTPLSTDARESLGVLLGRVRDEDPTSANPLFDRRMLLLEMVSRSTRRSKSTVPISALTVTLSHASLQRLADRAPRFVHERGHQYVMDLVSGVSEILTHGKRGRSTVRGVLGAVNALATLPGSLRKDVRVSLDRLEGLDDWELLRGPDAEFRDPCRFALIEAFGDAPGRQLLGEIFASAIPLALQDLAPQSFADAIGVDPEHALESYVELADRAGVLPDLLSRARAKRPAPKLSQIAAAYADWIRAVRDAFLHSRDNQEQS